MEEKTILIRARIIRKDDKVITVRLIDGFAQVETPIHADMVIEDVAPQSA